MAALRRGIDDAMIELIQLYQDLNPSVVDELTSEPSPLEFMRYVARNRPFVVRGGVSHWKATSSWNADYLTKTMGSQPVNVAVTPHGNADSVVTRPSDGKTFFVTPMETQKPFDEFLSDIRMQEVNPRHLDHVEYAQSQNDNMRDEYRVLLEDVEKDSPWARIALEKSPDAVNLWIGNSKSVTALHKDPYENIYCQIVGSKHFFLRPSTEIACVGEVRLPTGHYVRTTSGFEIEEDQPSNHVPFPTINPAAQERKDNKFSQLSDPLEVTLKSGDMLYLPAFWYHQVSQECSSEGFCCAVNYWYDLEYSGAFYPLYTFARRMTELNAQSEPVANADRQ